MYAHGDCVGSSCENEVSSEKRNRKLRPNSQQKENDFVIINIHYGDSIEMVEATKKTRQNVTVSERMTMDLEWAKQGRKNWLYAFSQS